MAKKRKDASKQPQGFIVSPYARLLDKIADNAGIAIHHVKGRPDLLKRLGLDAEDIDATLEQEALAWHAHEMRRIRHSLESSLGCG